MSVHRRVEARNRGLARISRLTSLTLSGGLVLSGGFAVLAAHAYAGRSRNVVPRTPDPLTAARRSPRARSGDDDAPGTTAPVAPLQAPGTLPQAGTGTSPQTSPPTVPQTSPPTLPPYSPPDTVVSGGS